MTAPADLRVAYTMSRFPKLSETFVVDEMLAVEAQGIRIELFPLVREQEELEQPDAARLVARARFQPFVSPSILASVVAWLVEDPLLVARTVAEALRGVAGSKKFTLGLLGILPKTLHSARLMRRSGVDHIHAHFAHHPALSALMIHRLTGIPFSFTGHGHDIQVDRRMLSEKIAASAFAVAVSEHNRSLMIEACPHLAHKVTVLHTGVDPVAIAPKAASDWANGRWFSEGTRVLAVGRLEEVKGHRVLLQALAELRSAGEPVQGILVGDGPERRSLLRLRRALGLEGCVQMPGSMTRPQVIDLMRSADVVAAPSIPTADGRLEGIPVVLMEAMSVETAVIASDLPGVRELVPGAEGVRVPPGDVTALAESLTRLGRDPGLRTRLGQAGRRRIEQRFDTTTTAEALASRFEASSARRSSRPTGARRPTRRRPSPPPS
ncbi:MAG: glycosyltransferase family 4 protein [Acidimicrobiales bacterium]